MDRKRKKDEAQAFLDAMLETIKNVENGYEARYCTEHGRVMIKAGAPAVCAIDGCSRDLVDGWIEEPPILPNVGKIDELMDRRKQKRLERIRRIQLLRQNLEK